MVAYDHLAKFRVDELSVHETTHWIIAVRQRQVTLGSCVFLPKREIPSLPAATAEELADLAHVAKWFEESTIQRFQAEKFNYVAAMMKDPILHFHAFPRYSGPRAAFDESWTDVAWPKVVSFDTLATQTDHLSAIRSALSD